LVIKSNNAKELEKVIETLYNDSELYSYLSKGAERRFINHFFSADNANYIKLYKSIN
jgi:glycosyltransferase involved in cell wall biosynthesis